MTPQQILAIAPRLLTQSQREFYFSEGYILLERVIPEDWIKRLRAATEELIDRGRKVTKTDRVYDLEPGHCYDSPRLRRVSNPEEQHPTFWECATKGPLPASGRRRITRR